MYLLASMFPEKRVMEITMGIIMVVTMAVTIIRIDSIIEDDIIKRNHHLSLWDLVRSLVFFMLFSNLCYKTKAIILFRSAYSNHIRYNWGKKSDLVWIFSTIKMIAKIIFWEHLGVQGILILRLIFKIFWLPATFSFVKIIV